MGDPAMKVLLEVDISVDYPGKARALDRVRFRVEAGEPVAVLGESGSGKSTLVLAVLGLIGGTGARVHGSVRLEGEELLTASWRRWRAIRGREIAFIPQSATASLNPALRIGTQLAEAWRAHQRGDGWKARSAELFGRLALPAGEEFLRRFPAEISVGQAQRVLIAMAMLHRPRLIVSDEPTSAVDPATRDLVRELLAGAGAEFGAANLLITHDVATVAGLCRRAIVLGNGRIVRETAIGELPLAEANAYARALGALYGESGTGEGLMELSESLSRESHWGEAHVGKPAGRVGDRI